MPSIFIFLTFPSFAGLYEALKNSYWWLYPFEVLVDHVLVALCLERLWNWRCLPATLLRFQMLLALDEPLNWHALKYEHTSFHNYLTTELKNIYLHKYKEKEKANLSNMLGFFFTPSLENWKGIKRVSGVGQGFTEYFKLSARGSKPFWLVYINSYYSLIIIMQFICNLICNIIRFLTGQAVLKKKKIVSFTLWDKVSFSENDPTATKKVWFFLHR